MKSAHYYREILHALKDARTWGGAMEPREGDYYREWIDSLRKETRKRRRRANRK